MSPGREGALALLMRTVERVAAGTVSVLLLGIARRTLINRLERYGAARTRKPAR